MLNEGVQFTITILKLFEFTVLGVYPDFNDVTIMQNVGVIKIFYAI